MVLLLALVVGRRFTTRVTYSSTVESVAISITLGVSVLAYGVFLLGLAGWIRPWVLAFAAVLCVAASWRTLSTWLRALVRPRPSGRARYRLTVHCVGLAVLGGIVLTLLVLLALYPPIQWDAISFHLPTAKHFLQSHGIGDAPFVRYPVFPAVGETLYAICLAWGSDLVPQVLEVACLVLVVLLLVGLSRRLGLGHVGAWASAILASHPLVIWVATSAYIDTLLTLFVTAAVYAFVVWTDVRDRKWLLLAGVFSGVAMGTKYSAIVVVAVLGLLVLVDALRKRELRSAVLFFGLPALCAVLPWLVRNVVYTGNPIWPFVGPVLGYGPWDRLDYQVQMADLVSRHIQPRSLGSFARLPWDLVYGRSAFHMEAPLSWTLLLSPLGLLLVRHRRLWVLPAIALGYTIFWFLTAQMPRYLLPVLPLFSFATAYGLDWVAGRIALRAALLKGSFMTIVVACMLVAPGCFYISNKVSQLGAIPATQDQRDAFLARSLPTYPAYQYLNDVKGSRYSLYALYDENMNYFADGICMGDHFGPARYRDVLSPGVDGPTLHRRLSTLGAGYMLVNLDRLPRSVPLPVDEYFAQHFRILYANACVCLYQLSKEAVESVEASELLVDPGFERVGETSAGGWVAAGSPALSHASPRSGNYAALGSSTENVFFQRVSVRGGCLYLLRESVRADSSGQQARLQVNWHDANGRFLSADIRVIEAGAAWKEYTMWASAPAGAVFAHIYASPNADSKVEFDDMSFRQVTYVD